MAAGDIRAGRAFVELGVVDKLKAGLNRAMANVQAFGHAAMAAGAKLGAAGAALSAPLMFAIHEFRGAGVELLDLNTITGVSVERMSALRQAAIGLGGSAEMATRGIQSVGAFMVQLAQGSPDALRAMAMLGVTFDELQRMSPDQQFLRLGDALRRIPNSFQRAEVAQRIFGDGSGQLLRVMQSGSAEWERMAEQARRAGQTMSGPDAAAAGALTRAWNAMTAAVSALWNKIGAALAPSFTVLLNLLADGINWLTRWVDQNRGLVRIIDLTATGLTAAGIAVTGFGGALAVAVPIVAGLIGAVSMIGGGIVWLATTAWAAVTGIIAFGGALITAAAAIIPMLPVIALVGVGLAGLAVQAAVIAGAWVAAGAAIYYFWDNIVEVAGKAAAAVADAWTTIDEASARGRQAIIDTAAEAWDAVTDSAAAAWDYLVGGWNLTLATIGHFFPEAVATAQQAWLDIQYAAGDAWDSIASAADTAWREVKRTWSSLVSDLGALWDGTVSLASSAWESIKTATGEAVDWMKDRWAAFAEGFGEVWGSVVAAIGAGQLTDAFAIGVAGLKLLWVQATNFLEEQWVSWTGKLHEGWVRTSNWVADTFEVAWATMVTGIKVAWAEAMHWMGERIVRLLDWIPGPLRRRLLGGVDTGDLLNTLSQDRDREVREAGREGAAAIDPNRASARERRARLEGVQGA